MQNINLLFEGDINDVDIICVPRTIADSLEQITDLYFTWMHENIDKHTYWVFGKDGAKTITYETESYIWWLNNYYNQCGGDYQAFIVLQHTQLDAEYPVVNF